MPGVVSGVPPSLVVIIAMAIMLTVCRAGSSSSTAKTGLSKSDKIKAIDKAARTVLACHPELPGMAFGVVQDGETVLASGYGYINPLARHRKRVNADTLFGIASLTKPFASALVLQTLKNVKLDRNAKVADILGKDFRFRDDLLTKQATVGDLLSHRMGIINYNFIRYQKNYNRKSLARDMAHFKRHGAFRDSHFYSNLGYGLVGLITEMLDKKNRTWEEMVTEELFAPLGMRRTYVSGMNVSRTNVAIPYHTTPRGESGTVSLDFVRHWGQIGSSDSVMSSASEMTHWMRLLLNGGVSTTGERILSKDVIETMFRPVAADEFITIIKPNAPESYVQPTYASGIRNGFYRGYKTAAHTGHLYGYTAMMNLMPSENIGVFIGFNGWDTKFRARTALALYTYDILLGKTPWLNDQTLCSFPKPWVNPKPSPQLKQSPSTESPRQSNSTRPIKPSDKPKTSAPPLPLARYTGIYSRLEFGEVSVSLHTIPNRLQLEYGIFRATLVHKRDNKFTIYGEGDSWVVTSVAAFFGDGHQIKSVQIYRFWPGAVFFKK